MGPLTHAWSDPVIDRFTGPLVDLLSDRLTSRPVDPVANPLADQLIGLMQTNDQITAPLPEKKDEHISDELL
jgi:hypothetical protein